MRPHRKSHTAYLISDHYILEIEAQSSVASLGSVGEAMLEVFVTRVHQLQAHTFSAPVRQIRDRISLHPEEKLDLHQLARELGYTDYYLSKKFRQETGYSVTEFSTMQKIEKAKRLLTGTQMPVREIAETLNICSQSYLGNLFLKHVGMTPTEYRNRSGS